jgi:RNA polymerase sigma-70 factor (ECF subfamily)
MDDEDLLRRVAQKEEDALRLLYARHSAAVYGLLCRLAGPNGDASDLLQETWLRAMRHLALFRGQSAFHTWLTGIALNCYREWRRRHPRDTSLDGAEARPFAPRADDDLAAVWQILSALPPEYRESIVLHDIEGFTEEEMAAALEIEPGTATSRVARARRAFRQRWAPGSAVNDDPLSPDEESRLQRARVPLDPPAGDDDRLMAALRERGLIRPRRLAALVSTAARLLHRRDARR